MMDLSLWNAGNVVMVIGNVCGMRKGGEWAVIGFSVTYVTGRRRVWGGTLQVQHIDHTNQPPFFLLYEPVCRVCAACTCVDLKRLCRKTCCQTVPFSHKSSCQSCENDWELLFWCSNIHFSSPQPPYCPLLQLKVQLWSWIHLVRCLHFKCFRSLKWRKLQ